jgi:(2Fe-2S) ferredoxin
MTPPFRIHVVACDGSSCHDRDAREVLKALRARVSERGIADQVRLTVANCLMLCGRGPNMVVYPDGVWYSGVTPKRVERIVDEHFVEGTPPADLVLDWSTVKTAPTF